MRCFIIFGFVRWHLYGASAGQPNAALEIQLEAECLLRAYRRRFCKGLEDFVEWEAGQSCQKWWDTTIIANVELAKYVQSAYDRGFSHPKNKHAVLSLQLKYLHSR